MRRLLIVSLICTAFAANSSADEKPVYMGFQLAGAKQIPRPGEDGSGIAMGYLQLQFFARFHPHFTLVNELGAARLEASHKHGYVIGLNEVGRVNFSKPGQSTFFADIGLGINYFGPQVAEVSGPMQFTVVAGPGFRLQPKDKPISYTFAYRFTHYSNAETQKPNVGLNLHTLAIGVQFK